MTIARNELDSIDCDDFIASIGQENYDGYRDDDRFDAWEGEDDWEEIYGHSDDSDWDDYEESLDRMESSDCDDPTIY